MNFSTTMQVIGRHKLLLVIGLLVAGLAAFGTAFRVETGTLAPRTITEYQAPTQVLVSDPTSVFSTKSAPQTLVEGQAAAASRDLASATVVYAYLVSSGVIQDLVEAQIGELGKHESISAVQRTTQPTATTNTGTYRLPILEIVGQAASPQRSEEISRTATAVFTAFAIQQQTDANVSADTRVQLTVIKEGDAAPIDGTNPALPIVAVGIGVLLAFIALIFAVDNSRANRRTALVAAADVTPAAPRVTSGHTGGMTRPAVPSTAMNIEAMPPPSMGARVSSHPVPPPTSPLAEPAHWR